MSFVAAPTPAPIPGIADTIAGEGWYPDLSIAAFRDAQRLGTLVTDGRARQALVGAVISAAIPLAAWQATQIAAGRIALSQAPSPAGLPATIGGEATAVVLWRRAVHAFAAADLAETHTDVSAAELARPRIEERATAADDLRRTAIAALRDLIGRTRTRVALV